MRFFLSFSFNSSELGGKSSVFMQHWSLCVLEYYFCVKFFFNCHLTLFPNSFRQTKHLHTPASVLFEGPLQKICRYWPLNQCRNFFFLIRKIPQRSVKVKLTCCPSRPHEKSLILKMGLLLSMPLYCCNSFTKF